jgi:putative hydrolase of the HAD superfamily
VSEPPSEAAVRAVRAVLFDLDDTLFDQRRWLAGAWKAVAAAAAGYGVDGAALLAALEEIAAEGTDRGRIIDRALERIGVGAADCPVPFLVEAFRHHRSPPLDPYAGVIDSLRRLRARVPIGLVTDGDPVLQDDKLCCLGLDGHFDVVVFTDSLGRSKRKPDPAGFLAALAALGVAGAEAVVIGDRPSKDIAGARAAGIRAVRVLTGEYRHLPDDPPAWAVAPDCATAVRLLEPLLA